MNSTRRTTISEPGDLVRVPFPHVERAVMVVRPALVFAVRDAGKIGNLLWVLMVTNAAREAWPGDVAIDDWQALGLLIPSKVRTAKVSTVEASRADGLGRLDDRVWRSIVKITTSALPKPS